MMAVLSYLAVQQRGIAIKNEQQALKNEQLAKDNAALAALNEQTAKENEKIAREEEKKAITSRKDAEHQKKLAEAQRSAARAQIFQTRPGELDTSTLLAIDSWQKWPSDEAEEILRKNISLLPLPVAQASQSGKINSLEFSPDGTTFLTASADGTACMWNVEDGQKLFCADSPESMNDAGFSPSGEFIVTHSSRIDRRRVHQDDRSRLEAASSNGNRKRGASERSAVREDRVDVRGHGERQSVRPGSRGEETPAAV